jgi:hypothetical protein
VMNKEDAAANVRSSFILIVSIFEVGRRSGRGAHFNQLLPFTKRLAPSLSDLSFGLRTRRTPFLFFARSLACSHAAF